MTLKDVERALLNKKVVDVGYAADMMCFSMGDEYEWYDVLKEVTRMRPEYALHFQCPWRITYKSQIIIASYDFYVECGNTTQFHLKLPEINKHFADNDVYVTSVETDCFGDLRIITNTDYILETFITSSYKREFWRLLTKDGHFVVWDEDEED